MVGANFKSVFEVETMRICAVMVHMDIQMDFGCAGFRTDFAYFFQQARSIAFLAALRHGYDVVNMDVVTAGQIVRGMETAYGYGILFAFFKNAQQAVAGFTLMLNAAKAVAVSSGGISRNTPTTGAAA